MATTVSLTFRASGCHSSSLRHPFFCLDAHRPELGDLKLLRVLDCSCNHIVLLPPRIGVLKSLVKLKCNGNKLVSLPEEIGTCSALEELICSENQLISLPRSLGRLHRLHTLLVCSLHCRVFDSSTGTWQVQNNALEMLPPTLADAAGALRVINCRNNPGLRMIPKQIGDDAALVLWILKLHRENEIECQQIIQSNTQLEQLNDFAQQRNAQLTAQLQKCNQERLELLRNMPTGCSRLNFVCKSILLRCRHACIAM